jgi:uncharacterized protein (UPF0332 family)
VSYASDLLHQAKHLANYEPKRPRQASLKRAVSAAYYSLFHHLASEAALLMLPGKSATTIRPVFQRAFQHGHMKNAAKSFAGGTVTNAWRGAMRGTPVSQELRRVASAFVDLQEARHEADYDLSRRFSRSEVRDLIDIAERATTAWHSIRKTPEAQVFLCALLVNESVSKRV